VIWVFSSPGEVTTDDEQTDDIMFVASRPMTDLYCILSYCTCMIYGLLACIIDSPGFVPAVFCLNFARWILRVSAYWSNPRVTMA